jgi:hypothetical protein
MTGLIPSGTGHMGPSEVLTGSTSGGISVVPSVTCKNNDIYSEIE